MSKWFIVFCLFLSGCAHVGYRGVVGDFFCKGKIFVQHDKETAMVNFSWQQRGRDYAIKLAGPMNMGAVLIEKQATQIKLYAKKQIVEATSAEILIQQMFGFSLPVSGLEYWLLGIPQPKIKYHKTLLNNQLISLEQQGWRIQYVNYVGGVPQKLLLEHYATNTKIKLIISKLS